MADLKLIKSYCSCWENIKNRYGEDRERVDIFYNGELQIEYGVWKKVHFCPFCGKKLAQKIYDVVFPEGENVAYKKLISETTQEQTESESFKEEFLEWVSDIHEEHKDKWRGDANIYSNGVCAGLDYAKQVLERLWEEHLEKEQ